MKPLPPPLGFWEIGPGVFLGPATKVGPDAYDGLMRVETGTPGKDHDCDGDHKTVGDVRPDGSAPRFAYPRSAAEYAESAIRQRPVLTFTYTNWRGERAVRNVAPPFAVVYQRNQWHHEPAWMLEGFDIDKQARRSFVLTKIEWIEHE